MTDDYERAVDRVQARWASAMQGCIDDGVPLETASWILVQISCGALKGTVGHGAAKDAILKVRDDIWAELTLLSERCN
jgi:hypothetical protein